MHNAFYLVLQDCPQNLTSTNSFLMVFQTLRAQEVAQAEAEEREDLEIAAEAPGTELGQAACQCAKCLLLWLFF